MEEQKLEEEKGYIPVDVLRDLLLRLPIKSLLRFKAVHSSWRGLISSDEFILIHLHHVRIHNHHKYVAIQQENRECLSLYTMTENPNDLELVELQNPFWKVEVHNHAYYKLLGSCDGLLLIALQGIKHYGGIESLVILNPSTREYKIITKPEFPDKKISSHYQLVIAGIGYDAPTNNYKVVTVFQNNKETSFSISVYNLKRSCWASKESCDFPYWIFGGSYGGITLANGISHWLASNKGDYDAIIKFDTAEEKFKEIVLPDNWPLEIISLGALEGCLCVTNFIHKLNKLELWIMKEYGVQKSWAKRMIISLEALPERPASFINNYRALENADAERDQVVFRIHDIGVCIYCQKMKIFKIVKLADSWRTEIAWYVESLVTPN